MSKPEFSPWPSYTEEEADAVRDVLLSNKVNYWTGQKCRDFEKAFAEWAGTEYAVALGNGTLALDVALIALGVGPGDEVIVTPRTFIASVSCVANVGAKPVFVDIDPDTGNITADTIRAGLTRRTKAIICVHLNGWPCDMDSIMALATEHSLAVIEDCAQAHGARYKGRPVGSIGHVGAWSFCQDKIMSTGGEGGMVTTNDPELWERMWSFKDHGKSWAAIYERGHPDAPAFRWLHESFGTNWRMTEMQAAIGLIQLGRMRDWHAARVGNANRILDTCAGFTNILRVPKPSADYEHGFYKCYAYVKPGELPEGWNRNRIINEIVERGVPCFSGSCSEVYLEKAFDGTDFRPAERLPVARSLGEDSLLFVVHPTLSDEAMSYACEVIHEVLSLASS